MLWSLNQFWTILLMIPLVSAYSFCLDLYIPLLPTIQTALEVSRSDIQLTNSLFMLFCGVGQLIFGPLSDRLGRLVVLFSSLILSLIANLICMHTMQYNLFLLGKVLQAIGACGTYLSCFATVRDLYPNPTHCTKMFSYLNSANATSAIIAPTIGTQLNHYFGWQSIFFVLALYALFSLLTCGLYYNETVPRKTSKKKQSVIQQYWSVLTHINYQVYTLPAALGLSSFFSYYSISPYLYQQTFGLSKEIFSVFFGSCGLTFFISSCACGQIVHRIGILRTLSFGLICHMIGCIGIIISFTLFNQPSLLIMHSSILLLIWGSALMVSSGIGGTMAPFKTIAGSAFALISAYKFMMCYILGELSMFLYNNTSIPLGILLFSINLCASLVVFLFHKNLTQTPHDAQAKLSEEMVQTIDNIL